MLKVVFFLIIFSIFGCSHSTRAPEKADSPPNVQNLSTKTKKEMVLALVRQIDRVDGEGLLPRQNRHESWEKTINKLSDEAAKSDTLYDLGRVFKRLDATYPNLHAKVFLIPDLDEKKMVGSVLLPFKFYAKEIGPEHKTEKFLILNNNQSESQLQNGDELLSINSIPIQKWSDENFLFCKFPLRQQCEIEFFDNFRNELLGWNRHQPLKLQIKRGSQVFSVSLKAGVSTKPPDDENNDLPCGAPPNRYKGFTVAYEGQNLCAFESAKNHSIVAIRIRSFQYEDFPFAVLDGEVQMFWNNYWRKKSGTFKTMILDVIDNHGGQSPIPYYGLFFSKPYQEQYVKFKKVAEFEQKEILESLFWGDRGKELWFENIKKDGSFSKAAEGDFLGQIPQFCANRKKDCREGLFEPRKNRFSGKIKILMDHWCVSSCVGFVSNIKDLFKDRVQTFGIPDSGDSAYSRLSVFASPLTDGKVETKVASMKKAKNPDIPEPWVRQVVSVTRSTDKDGNLLSGKPQNIDVWVPRRWNQSYDDWASDVFSQAVKQSL